MADNRSKEDVHTEIGQFVEWLKSNADQVGTDRYNIVKDGLEELVNEYDAMSEIPPTEERTLLDKAESFKEGALDTLTFGFADEITAGVRTGFGQLGDYDKAVEEERQESREAAEMDTGAYYGGQAAGFAGSLLIPGGAISAGVKGGRAALSGISRAVQAAGKSKEATSKLAAEAAEYALRNGNKEAAEAIAKQAGISMANVGKYSRPSKPLSDAAKAIGNEYLSYFSIAGTAKGATAGALHGAGHAEEGERLDKAIVGGIAGGTVGGGTGIVGAAGRNVGNVVGAASRFIGR